MRLNIACKWWGGIGQKYGLYAIVIFTLVQLINHSYRFVKWIFVSLVKLFVMEHCFCVLRPA
jgi:hypothetical protein